MPLITPTLTGNCLVFMRQPFPQKAHFIQALIILYKVHLNTGSTAKVDNKNGLRRIIVSRAQRIK